MSDLGVRDAVSGVVEAVLAIYRPFVLETAVSFELYLLDAPVCQVGRELYRLL